jgi:putative sterol carrier protein
MSNVRGNVESRQTFAKFSDLTRQGDTDVYASFDRMAKLLEGSGIEGKVQFSILDSGEWKPVSLHLNATRSVVERERMEKPELEILTKREIWERIARGVISPLEAFVTGQMRVRGNYKLGPRIIKHLAASPGRIDIC